MKKRNKRFQVGGQQIANNINQLGYNNGVVVPQINVPSNIDPLDDSYLVEDSTIFNSQEQLDRMSNNQRINTAIGNYDQDGQVVNENIRTIPNQQPFQFFNPYSGVDLESGAQYLGESINTGNTAGTILGAAKVGLGLGRNILGGMGRGNVMNESLKNYYDNQRKSMTGSETYSSFQQGGSFSSNGFDGYPAQQGFKVFGQNIDFRNVPKVSASNTLNRRLSGEHYPETEHEAVVRENNVKLGNRELFKKQPTTKGTMLDEIVITTKAKKKGFETPYEAWVKTTGLPWSEAKKMGFTTGSAKDNLALKKRLEQEGNFTKQRNKVEAVIVNPYGVVDFNSNQEIPNHQTPFSDSLDGVPQQEFQDGGQAQDPTQVITQMLQQGATPEQIIQDMVNNGVPQEEAMAAIEQATQQGGEGNMEQEVANFIQQALAQGMTPEQILQELVNGGVPQEQAIQMIESLMGGQQQEQPQMQNGGEFLNALRGKKIVDYTYNEKTGNYDIQYE